MSNIVAIARRELGAYFDSPLAYFVVPAYVVLVGGFALWFDDLFAAGAVSLRGVFLWSAIFLVLLVPAITMRLFAEERRTGSLELLVTMPITEAQLVLGKFAAAMALVAVAVATTLTYVVTLAVLGTPEVGEGGPPMIVRAFSETGLDFGPAVCGYLGLLLFGGALAAIGTAASSLTSNQIVAFLLALVISLFPYVTGFFLERVPAELLPVVQHLSFDYHFNQLARGVVDTRSLVFWGSVAAFALHVATFSLERRRLS
ncbi:MAG: ABC transporter permease [Myxococcota bacterium]